MAEQKFDQTGFFKATNPESGGTDIFQDVNGVPKYIDAETGKGLFAQGLNADLLPAKPFPNLTSAGTGDFSIDIPSVIDVSQFKDAFSQGITKDDLTSFTEQLRTREAEVAKNLIPTEREKGLQTQLAGVVSGIEKAGSDLQARPGIDFFTLDRGKSELQRQNELTVANLQRQIQVEQTTRGQALESSKFLLESAKAGFDTLLKGYDAIQNRATNLFNIVNTLNTQAQNSFNSIVTQLAGLTFDQLDPNTKDRVRKLALNLGIPEAVVRQGLQLQADKIRQDREAVLFDQDIKRQQLAIERQKANLAAGGGVGGFSGFTGGKAAGGGKTTPTDPQAKAFDDSFNFVAGFLTADQRKFATQAYNQIAATGDKQAAKEYLEGLVLNAVPTEQQKVVVGRFQAIAAIEDIEKGLQAYKAAGGKTGIIKGSLEQISNKLGKTTDPKVAMIANDIRIAIQSYRQAISGAAFTEAESKEYEQIFPSIGKGSELNEAKVSSLKNAYNRNNRVVVERYIGPGNYNKVWGKPVSNTTGGFDDAQLQKDFDNFLKGTPSGSGSSGGSRFQINPTPKPANSSFSFF